MSEHLDEIIQTQESNQVEISRPKVRPFLFGIAEMAACVAIVRAGRDSTEVGDIIDAVPTFVAGIAMGVDGLRRVLYPAQQENLDEPQA